VLLINTVHSKNVIQATMLHTTLLATVR